MKVRDVMTSQVAHCRPEDDDLTAARLMWENDCGIVPVVDASERVVGVVTDRDLCMAAYTRGSALDAMRVGDAMSQSVHSCRGDDSVEDALAAMRDAQVRRLPVLDGEDRIIGMLSLNDIVLGMAELEPGRKRTALTSALTDSLNGICAHRHGSTEIAPPLPTQAGRESKAGDKAAKADKPVKARRTPKRS